MTTYSFDSSAIEKHVPAYEARFGFGGRIEPDLYCAVCGLKDGIASRLHRRPIVRFRVPVVIEVDLVAWNDEYGSRDTEESVRSYAGEMAQNAVREAFRHLTDGVVTFKDK